MQSIKIINLFGEKLDIWIEGSLKARTTIILVHGFATDKHETAGYFDDLSKALGKQFRIVRFDLSGCGQSEGKTEDINYRKHAQDLESIINYVKKSYSGRIFILAQSMGCFITALLNPLGIAKSVFTGLPNSNTKYIAKRLKERFGARKGGIIDYKGISIFPRSTGKSQRIGPLFWKELFSLDPAIKVEVYSNNTKLLVIHPKQDEVVGNEYLIEYSRIPNIEIMWIDGDHSFRKKENRKALIETIQQYFN